MDLKQINEVLNTYIRPQTFPIALKLCESEKDLPEKARMPMKDLGYPVTLCQATGLTRRFGWTMAVGKDDQCCIGGAQVMGFVAGDESELAQEGKRFKPQKYKYHVTASLDKANFEPDAIVIYGNSAQIMRLVQAVRRGPEGPENVNAIATGSSDCGDIAARTLLSDECQFILPSGGDRVFGLTQDHEVIFTIPKTMVESVLKGLEITHKAGFRYPVLADLRHRPSLPPNLEIPKDAG
jgi:uncharacterized protein (DUF169 family)